MNLLKTTNIFLLLIVIMSCSKDDDATKIPPIATSVEIVSGNNQLGETGTPLADSIVVIVKDKQGNPFSGAVVNFTVSQGTVSSNSAITDSNGKTSIIWTLGLDSGLQSLTVSVFGADSTTALTGSPLTVSANATVYGCFFIFNDTQQSIGPNAGTVTNSIINISAQNYIVNQIGVLININYLHTEDLDIYLVAPNGTELRLSTDNGNGSSVGDYIETIFYDLAPTPIVDGINPFTGHYQPEDSLSEFNGLQSAGDWTLKIIDDFDYHEGLLINWAIQICN